MERTGEYFCYRMSIQAPASVGGNRQSGERDQARCENFRWLNTLALRLNISGNVRPERRLATKLGRCLNTVSQVEAEIELR